MLGECSKALDFPRSLARERARHPYICTGDIKHSYLNRNIIYLQNILITIHRELHLIIYIYGTLFIRGITSCNLLINAIKFATFYVCVCFF